MLLKYMSSDLLNSSIADMGSGVQLFVVRTESFYTTERIYHPVAGAKDTCIRRRRTVITDIHQRQVAEIVWAGRVPLSISLKGETLDGVTPLFNGCESVTIVYVTGPLSPTVAHDPTSVRSSPHRSSELKVPTRIGAVWVATRHSLELRCSNSGKLRSAFYLNSVQIGHRLRPSPIPGMGSHFLEVHDVHSAHMVEMMVSCLIMDILRRNVFDVSPHDYQYLGPCRPSDPTSRSLIARLAGISRA
ncbi:hypothetical protein EDB92DRAFT_10370 [Lactarius akahatsu]|uniref:Uncharacterized protein n=1 Tax=Lactarius akahatsu TaxID=416441 RepID=A0AAD4LQ51_9AGAM|nr:hypothetical protein EDB92DRAFT_10370 [Lactarius akahatsu]